MNPAAAAVVAAYAGRSRFARAETADVRRPRLLGGLLDSATHIAEIPCGAGHFLADYARAGVTVTLVDASPAMLSAARRHAHDAGVPTEHTHTVCTYVQDLVLPETVDLVVVPHAALNQLARQTPLPELLAYLRSGLRPRATVLVQVACSHPDGRVDTATFYDPIRPHEVWFTDRWFDPTQAGGARQRRRRQHRDDDRLRVAFDYRSPTGTCLHATTVELALFAPDTLITAFVTAGFVDIRFQPGQNGLSEVQATSVGGPR